MQLWLAQQIRPQMEIWQLEELIQPVDIYFLWISFSLSVPLLLILSHMEKNNAGASFLYILIISN